MSVDRAVWICPARKAEDDASRGLGGGGERGEQGKEPSEARSSQGLSLSAQTTCFGCVDHASKCEA